MLLCLPLALGGISRAQEQTLSERVLNPKVDMSQVNPMQTQSFKASAFGTSHFKTSEFRGTKSAEVKTFKTRSFLGIKNPWLGKTVYETSTSRLAKQTARESKGTYETESYAVREYAEGRKADVKDSSEKLPKSTAPRPYLVPGKAQGAMDRFTQNLHKDLSIEEVQALLNKGN